MLPPRLITSRGESRRAVLHQPDKTGWAPPPHVRPWERLRRHVVMPHVMDFPCNFPMNLVTRIVPP